MKRSFLIVFLLFSLAVNLSASYFVSNELGQKKEEVSSYPASEWVLDERGNDEILYHNGVEYSRKTTSSSGWTKTEGEREERVILSSDGTVERRIITLPGSTEEYNYFYSGKLLKGYNYSVDGVLKYKVEYTTTNDGSLLYYREKDEGVYLTDEWFVFENGEKIEVGTFKNDEVISTATEDGGYTEKSGSVERRYDSRGRLLSENDGEKLTEYSYSEDGSLSERKETGADGIYITSISEDGETVSRYTPEGVLVSQRRTLEYGDIEEKRFVDGKAKYVFIYDSDGRRIKDAYAL